MENNHLSVKHKTIIEMWEKGITSSKISKEIGISRSAVMGIVVRLRKKGLIMRSDKINAKTQRKQISKPKTAPKKAPKKPDPPAPVVRKPKENVAAVLDFIERKKAAHGVTIFGLKSNSCRFIADDVNAEKTIYCGAKIKRGKYCEDHAALCYNNPYRGDDNANNASAKSAFAGFNAKRQSARTHYR